MKRYRLIEATCQDDFCGVDEFYIETKESLFSRWEIINYKRYPLIEGARRANELAMALAGKYVGVVYIN